MGNQHSEIPWILIVLYFPRLDRRKNLLAIRLRLRDLVLDEHHPRKELKKEDESHCEVRLRYALRAPASKPEECGNA